MVDFLHVLGQSRLSAEMNATALKLLHVKCRGAYPGATVSRFTVPDQQVCWKTPFAEYAPTAYTAPVVLAGPVWADKDFMADKALAAATKWNAVDGKIDRRSFEGEYELNENSVPQNPLGRTGMSGRGLLGRFGPNHAADPIVTRYVTFPTIYHIHLSPVLFRKCFNGVRPALFKSGGRTFP